MLRGKTPGPAIRVCQSSVPSSLFRGTTKGARLQACNSAAPPGKFAPIANHTHCLLTLPGATSFPLILKFTPLLGVLFTLTTTGPLVAPLGTEVVIDDCPHETTGAATPENVTTASVDEVPNPLPLITTGVPVVPPVGDRAEIRTSAGVVNVRSADCATEPPASLDFTR